MMDVLEAAIPDAREFHRREFWRAFAPDLHIEDAAVLRDLPRLPQTPPELARWMADLKEDGYSQASARWAVDVSTMAATVRRLSAARLSPVFAFLYDEFWVPFYQLHPLYMGLLGGGYAFLPAFWVWNVDPGKGDAGWKPHRDKGWIALFDDRSPKALTTWIPLSAATPLNGCMYIVPAQHDPTYGTPSDTEWKFDYPSIRALPGAPGDFFIWNQAVIHWGGKTSPRARESRVSMAFEFQRLDVPAFNEPLLDPQRPLRFEARLKLIAKQLLQYQHMYALEPAVACFATELLGEPPRPVAAPVSKVGRNDPCPCGSNKKYKQCHGKAA